MSTMSMREKAVLAALGTIILYALAVALWFLMQADAWKKSQKHYRTAQATYAKECRLISEKAKWTDEYETEKARMPSFKTGQDTDTVWLDKLIALAKEYNISVQQWKPHKEAAVGDVTELEMDAVNVECPLEMLVRFMHALESTKDGMFDVKSLSLKPSAKKGYLKGAMTITCAYMRED